MNELGSDDIAVLDLKPEVGRKAKSLQFSVNYKKTHTSINVDKDLIPLRYWKELSSKDLAIEPDQYVTNTIFAKKLKS